MSRYEDLIKKIGIKFKDESILDNAFIHRSYLNEHKKERIESNERLEFLGDAVLELISTQYLFNKHPDKTEGELTNLRSALVQGRHLAEISKELNLGEYLYLSKGEEASGGKTKNYILANVMEAVIGAIYLDKGFDEASKFVNEFILSRLDEIIEKNLFADPKSTLQELIQEKLEITPTYEIISEEGPDHDKEFEAGVYFDEKLIAKGKGSSKQKAESEAAENALKDKSWQ